MPGWLDPVATAIVVGAIGLGFAVRRWRGRGGAGDGGVAYSGGDGGGSGSSAGCGGGSDGGGGCGGE